MNPVPAKEGPTRVIGWPTSFRGIPIPLVLKNYAVKGGKAPRHPPKTMSSKLREARHCKLEYYPGVTASRIAAACVLGIRRHRWSKSASFHIIPNDVVLMIARMIVDSGRQSVWLAADLRQKIRRTVQDLEQIETEMQNSSASLLSLERGGTGLRNLEYGLTDFTFQTFYPQLDHDDKRYYRSEDSAE